MWPNIIGIKADTLRQSIRWNIQVCSLVQKILCIAVKADNELTKLSAGAGLSVTAATHFDQMSMAEQMTTVMMTVDKNVLWKKRRLG